MHACTMGTLCTQLATPCAHASRPCATHPASEDTPRVGYKRVHKHHPGGHPAAGTSEAPLRPAPCELLPSGAYANARRRRSCSCTGARDPEHVLLQPQRALLRCAGLGGTVFSQSYIRGVCCRRNVGHGHPQGLGFLEIRDGDSHHCCKGIGRRRPRPGGRSQAGESEREVQATCLQRQRRQIAFRRVSVLLHTDAALTSRMSAVCMRIIARTSAL